MSFALLGTRQIGGAIMLLGVQSAATAVSALAQHQPLIAAATLLVNLLGACWLLRDQAPDFDVVTPPIGGAKLGIVAGAALAVLSQSAGPLANPLAVVLLSVLLAATRRHPLMHIIALVALQNGIVGATSLVGQDPELAAAGFFPVIPLAMGLALDRITLHNMALPRWLLGRLGWVQLGLAAGLLAATLAIRLDPLATLFAPLLALWGLAEAWATCRRRRSVILHLSASIEVAFMVLAVATKQPLVGLLAAAIAAAAAIFPTLRRRWDTMLLAGIATGLALFGILTVPLGQPLLSYAALVLGLAAIAATAPPVGMVAAILILRLATQSALPPLFHAILISVAVAGLLWCAVALMTRGKAASAGLLQLAQISLVAVTLGLDQPQARFAACVMLILLILTNAAGRLLRAEAAPGPGDEAMVKVMPLIGLFPGQVLSLLAIAAQAPFLLLPVGAGFTAMLIAAVPRHRPTWSWATSRSAAWLPIGMALLFGFCAPDDLVAWLRAVTAGIP